MNPPFKRIVGVSLSVLLATAGILRLFIREEPAYAFSGYAALLALTVLVLCVANLVGAGVAKAGHRQAWLLSALLVLLIGLGVCAVGVQSVPQVQELP